MFFHIALLEQVINFYNEVEGEVDIHYEDEYADAIDLIKDMIGTIIEVFTVFKDEKSIEPVKKVVGNPFGNFVWVSQEGKAAEEILDNYKKAMKVGF